MSRFFVLIIASLIFTITNCNDQVKDTYIIGSEIYMNEVMQMFINDLEEDGLCQIRMPDFTQDIDELMYGVKVKGKVNYHDGFVTTILTTKIKDVPKTYLFNSTSNTSIEAIYFIDDISIIYDMTAELNSGPLKATGVYLIKGVEYTVTVTNDILKNETSVNMKWLGTHGNFFGRINFIPNNDITAIIGREFSVNLDEISNGIKLDWPKVFLPYLEKIVKEKIKYPEIAFDRNL